MEVTLDAFMDYINPMIRNCKKLWRKSPYFRIVSIVTGSLTASLLARNIYVYAQRKYLNLPPGHFGLPFVGGSFIIFNQLQVEKMAKYGPVASLTVGNMNCILINNPYLANKYYSNPRTLDFPTQFLSPISFATSNGKKWSERRRIISSNLMSTMRASYVEDVTKKFIKTKLFPLFDKDIQNGNMTNMKQLFRPIGFNIVLQACFGTEIESLDDPFWKRFDAEQKRQQSHAELQIAMSFAFGNNKFSNQMQDVLIGGNIWSDAEKQINLLEEFASKNINKQQEKDSNVKLFNDYVNDYTQNSNTKWSKKQFLADMVVMIGAAQDTTYAALSFALLLAAKYPNIQNELHQEIVHAFGQNIDNIELKNEGILKIPKLRAFIQEVLRMYPPSPVSGIRQLCGDEPIKLNTTSYGSDKDYNVSCGTMTIVNVAAIGQNPKYWIKDYNENTKHSKYKDINMRKVNLQFWMDENGHFTKKKNLASFWTFHKGKRDCVGQALAMKNLMIVLAMIFMKYNIESSCGTTDFEIIPYFGGAVNEPKNKEIRLKQR